MPPAHVPDGAARPDAAAINRAIRAFTRGRLYWSREALAELARLQGAYLDALRADEEERLSRGDVIEAA